MTSPLEWRGDLRWSQLCGLLLKALASDSQFLNFSVLKGGKDIQLALRDSLFFCVFPLFEYCSYTFFSSFLDSLLSDFLFFFFFFILI